MSTSYGDGSWELSIAVVEVGAEKTLRVKGDLHVGGLMVRLVQQLGECFWVVYRSIQAAYLVYRVGPHVVPVDSTVGSRRPLRD